MKKFLHRLIWKTPKERFTFFLQIGVIHTLLIGITFSAFSWVSAVESLQLFEFTEKYLPSIPGSFWGTLLVLAAIGHIAEMYWRGHGFGPVAAMVGFMCWLYALLAYVLVAPVSILMVTFWPLSFWTWYYFSALEYRRELDNDLIDPVE